MPGPVTAPVPPSRDPPEPRRPSVGRAAVVLGVATILGLLALSIMDTWSGARARAASTAAFAAASIARQLDGMLGTGGATAEIVLAAIRGGDRAVLETVLRAGSLGAAAGDIAANQDGALRIRVELPTGSVLLTDADSGTPVIESRYAVEGGLVQVVAAVPLAAVRRAWLRAQTPRFAIYLAIIGAVCILAARYFAVLRRIAAADDRDRVSLEARFRDGIESMEQGFVLWDAEERLVTWNSRYAQMFPHSWPWLVAGMPLLTLTRINLRFVDPGASDAVLEARIADRLRRFRGCEGRWQITLPDGRTIEVLEHRTSDGGTVTTYTDMTAAQAMLARLAASERLFRDGIESMGDGFLLWGPDRRMRNWNQRLLEIMPHLAPIVAPGLPQRDFVERACHAAYPELTQAEREAWIRDRLEKAWEPAYRSTLELSGERFVAITQRRTSDGGLVATYNDVTADLRAARRLAASEAEARRLALAAANVRSGITILDAGGRITWMNPAMAEMTGLAPGQAVGRTPRSLFAADPSSAGALTSIAGALESGRRVRAEALLPRSGGDPIWIELDAAPILGDDGAIEGVVVLHTDVTERKRNQQELEHALVAARSVNEQQRRFIAVASHEFRTPLAIIDGATQRIIALLRGTMPEAGLARRLGRIRAAVARMTGTMDLMLSSARLDEGRLNLEAGRVDLTSLVGDVCDRQQQVTPEFVIATDAVEAGLEIEADARLLDQVLTNLVSNAVKYSGASRRVEVRAARRRGAVEIAVRDFGIGVAAADLSRLFTRFFRAKTAAGLPGTGIGLHLARELVLLHGGSIDVESRLGAGSTFVVRLPAAPPIAVDAPSAVA